MAEALHFYEGGEEVPTADYPKFMQGSFLSKLWRTPVVTTSITGVGRDTKAKKETKAMRAQIPFIVTIPYYPSALHLEPIFVEYFLYAPNAEVGRASYFAVNFWKKWQKTDKGYAKDDEYPKIEGAVIAEVIEDDEFAETWRDVRGRSHKAAGDPDDPFAFTCFDPDFKIYRNEDFAKGTII